MAVVGAVAGVAGGAAWGGELRGGVLAVAVDDFGGILKPISSKQWSTDACETVNSPSTKLLNAARREKKKVRKISE